VKSDAFIKEATSYVHITQGFLNTHPERTVRVRILGEHAFLTVKGLSDKAGVTRFEWEIEIGMNDAKELLILCEDHVVDKTRYYISMADHIFEVDQFHGNNAGLVIAEIELRTIDEKFDVPFWLGQEVTGDIRYYNAQLSRKPYKFW
jgi:CYTH domain-containing protein